MPLSHLIGWQMTAAPHLETAGAGAGGGLGAAGDDPQKLAALYRLTDRLFRAETEQDVYEAGLDAMGEAMGCERASILRFDEQKTMRFVAWRGLSASYRAAVDGHTPWRAGQRDVEPIMVADIEAAGESEAIIGAILGENIRGLAFFPLTIAGGVVGKFMVYYPGRHDFTEREVAVAVTISRQLGFALERLAAAEILRRERERFEAVIESIPVMIKIYDPQSGELILNREFTRILGSSSKDAERLDLMAELFPDEAVRAQVAEFMESCPEGWLDTPMTTASGEEVEASWANIRLSDGARVGIGVDITERHRAVERQHLLLREMDHRIRNLFTLAGGIVSLSGRRTRDVDALVEDVRDRLAALARAHALTLSGGDGGDLLPTAKLQALTAAILSPYADDEGRIAITGDDVELSHTALSSLALLLYEFATNAAKYGALSAEHGRVVVETTRQAGQMKLVWREFGGPLLDAEGRPEGFGSRLMRASTRQLDGELRIERRAEGVEITLLLPLERNSPETGSTDQRLAS